MFRLWIVIAALFGAIGVSLASWSSHGLAHFLDPDTLAVGLERARAANLHHMLHTLALFGIALWVRQGANAWVHGAGVLFAVGILGFSGGIYGLRIFAGIHEGPWIYVVPLGGASLILGWLALAIAGLRPQPAPGASLRP
ncbi:DUF423 domain-containing protein [Pseudothauera rhizosphaerae]|uniref:DUF423 domain-containing protein n=1 Tax=Pseudothauera rhizosphaerae TaxID=2565932 RepID=A0A4S4AYX8_9RHOO|nr:DUF423 domain-containing protein [Pseudothauera rhizosphaerae]THF65345.1 DUF423 domain-containing protein [Pseudothauera rhizosphaerae]